MGRDAYRHCPCGTRLASDNSGELCALCERKLNDSERLEGWLQPTLLAAEAAADVFSRPRDFGNKREFLAALTEPLALLCEAFERKVPDFQTAFKVSGGAATDRRASVGKLARGGHVKAPSEAPRVLKAPPGVRIYRDGAVG